MCVSPEISSDIWQFDGDYDIYGQAPTPLFCAEHTVSKTSTARGGQVVNSRRTPGLVSIVVTSWNRKRYIRQCLESLARQTYKNIEIIVVDDGSGDGTQRVIREWKASLPKSQQNHVILVPLPRNIGYSGALTTAMFLARGEFIATQDSDDVSHRDRIRKQVRYLQKHRSKGLVGTNYRVVHHGKIDPTNPNWLAYGSSEISKAYARGAHCITCGSLLFRGALFDKLGGLTRRINGAEDYEFVAKIHSNGTRMANLRDVLYYIRRHSEQRSRKFYR